MTVPKVDRNRIKLRESLIPIAEKYANDLHGELPGDGDRDTWVAAWNLAFHSKMEELVKMKLQEEDDDWLVGGDNIAEAMHYKSWKHVRKILVDHNAPLKVWLDGRPAIKRNDLKEFIKNNVKLRQAA